MRCLSRAEYEEEYNEWKGRDFDPPMRGQCDFCERSFLFDDLMDGLCEDCAAELQGDQAWE
jgi:hypothetical protein